MASADRIDCHLHYYASAFADQLLGQARGTAGGNVPIRAVSSARAGWRELAALGLPPASVQRIERDNARRLLGTRHASRHSSPRSEGTRMSQLAVAE